MNYNLVAYPIFLIVICFITIRVGWLFYKNGEIYLIRLIKSIPLAKNINNILLTGYYLVNIGYAILSIAYWDHINSFVEMLDSLTRQLGIIISILALLHYNNVFALNYLIKFKSLKS